MKGKTISSERSIYSKASALKTLKISTIITQPGNNNIPTKPNIFKRSFPNKALQLTNYKMH